MKPAIERWAEGALIGALTVLAFAVLVIVVLAGFAGCAVSDAYRHLYAAIDTRFQQQFKDW